ncbi:hypothetical protein GMPD_14610 [Geomonas paludis]|uniref:Uncharacterized protein n=1 Tax=Geomonas paludis TaxID=2740185 RepID=A0A6V8MU15_9BACT|nr:hypothetical protein GMPD_14610 [Geomonas paludis]
MMNAAPPFRPVSAGNFQMLPKPTAEPSVAAMTPKPDVKLSRALVTFTFCMLLPVSFALFLVISGSIAATAWFKFLPLPLGEGRGKGCFVAGATALTRPAATLSRRARVR